MLSSHSVSFNIRISVFLPHFCLLSRDNVRYIDWAVDLHEYLHLNMVSNRIYDQVSVQQSLYLSITWWLLWGLILSDRSASTLTVAHRIQVHQSRSHWGVIATRTLAATTSISRRHHFNNRGFNQSVSDLCPSYRRAPATAHAQNNSQSRSALSLMTSHILWALYMVLMFIRRHGPKQCDLWKDRCSRISGTLYCLGRDLWWVLYGSDARSSGGNNTTYVKYNKNWLNCRWRYTLYTWAEPIPQLVDKIVTQSQRLYQCFRGPAIHKDWLEKLSAKLESPTSGLIVQQITRPHEQMDPQKFIWSLIFRSYLINKLLCPLVLVPDWRPPSWFSISGQVK